MARSTVDRRAEPGRHPAADEISALENVAEEILSVRETDRVLLSIARKALALLEADMSAVLLVEGDELFMRSCIGHQDAATAETRMRAGQGLAGRVLQTGEPCKVDSYLESDAITHDFDPLARIEHTRSALAAPLQVHGELIGVLEVWRRREAPFHDRQVRRLVALANLAAIAIENARLYADQQETMRQLAGARESLSQQLRNLTEAASLQRALLALLLDGEGPAAIARTFVSRLGGQVAIFTEELEPLASYPRDVDVGQVAQQLRRLARAVDARTGTITARVSRGRWLSVQAVQAGQETTGWLCVATESAPDPNLELAIGEAALACALSQLERRRAGQSRAVAREEILWDLLEGGLDHRHTAAARAERLHIDVAIPQRVLHGLLDGFDGAVQAEGWDASQIEAARRDLRTMAGAALAQHDLGELVSLRHNTLVAVVPGRGREAVADLVRTLRAGVAKAVPGVTTTWGASAAHDRAVDLRAADGEAGVALRAAAGMRTERPVLYDELGIVRLLLDSGDKPDLHAFVEDVIGPLVAHDEAHDGALARTLRAYFEADCNQVAAATGMDVHHKTVRYRLDRIEELTGLDLRRHDDRLRADLALKVHEAAQGLSGEA